MWFCHGLASRQPRHSRTRMECRSRWIDNIFASFFFQFFINFFSLFIFFFFETVNFHERKNHKNENWISASDKFKAYICIVYRSTRHRGGRVRASFPKYWQFSCFHIAISVGWKSLCFAVLSLLRFCQLLISCLFVFGCVYVCVCLLHSPRSLWNTC